MKFIPITSAGDALDGFPAEAAVQRPLSSELALQLDPWDGAYDATITVDRSPVVGRARWQPRVAAVLVMGGLIVAVFAAGIGVGSRSWLRQPLTSLRGVLESFPIAPAAPPLAVAPRQPEPVTAPPVQASPSPVPASAGTPATAPRSEGAPLVPQRAASAAVTAPRVNEEDAIRAALGRYRDAYERLDAMAAKRVRQESQSIAFDDCKTTVTGAAAVAFCRGTATYIGRPGRRNSRTESREWTFTLQKAGNTWEMQSVQVR